MLNVMEIPALTEQTISAAHANTLEWMMATAGSHRI